ncbi:MAG: hypothetical protein K5695_13680 [Oscillospiraceae bacterium]|nr:hypothetical protein [Oscillospiraceae bacterium]
MKDNKLQTLLRAADAQEIADFPASSEQEKERIFARMQAKRRHLDAEPAESETFVVTEAKRPKMHFAAIGVAACMIGVLGLGGYLWMHRPVSPVQPGGEVRQEDTCYTPFGDITGKRPWFTVPLTEADWANPKDAGKIQERLGEDGYLAREYFIDESLLPSLQAVFETYGWRTVRPDLLTAEQKTEPTRDFLIMHLATDPENHGGEYLTACFNFGAGIIRVDAPDGTTYYEMDGGELKRCLYEIVVQGRETEYAPLQLDWSGLSVYEEDTGSGYWQLSPGQLKAFGRMLNATDWYPWSMYYQSNPDNGGYWYQFRATNADHAAISFCFYPDSQLMDVYRFDPEDPGKLEELLYLRPDYPAFFDEVNALVHEDVYPFAPTTMEAVFAEQSGDTTQPLPQSQNHALCEKFSKMHWQATDDAPRDGAALTLQCEDAHGSYLLYFYPNWHVIEWWEDITLMERFKLSSDDWQDIEGILDGKQVGQPFMSLMLSSAYTTFTCHNAWENGKRFGVELPEDGTSFTADLFRLQELFDEKEWITADIPNYNWRPGYITMHVGEGDLFIGTTPIDNNGNYVLLWKSHSGSMQYYYADETFITRLVQILAETQQEIQPASSPEETRAADAARRFLDQTAPEISAGWDCRNVSIVMQLPSHLLTVADEIPDDASYYLVEFYSSADPSTIGKVFVSYDGVVLGGPADYFPGIENTEDSRWVIYD